MTIEKITLDEAADLVMNHEAPGHPQIEAGTTVFVPCVTKDNELVYVMLGALASDTAIIRGA